ILVPPCSARSRHVAGDLRDGTSRTTIKPPRSGLGSSRGGERGQERHAQRCCHCDWSNVAFHFLILSFGPIVTTRVWQLKPDSLIVLSALRVPFAQLKLIENARLHGELMELRAVYSHQVIPSFSACFRLESPVKRRYEIIGGGHFFEDEETNPKHRYGSIRLAQSQKRHKGRYHS